jgi:hypothetical protein
VLLPAHSFSENTNMETQTQEFSFERDFNGNPRTLFTRSQWRWKGRMVDARNIDAIKTISTPEGFQLRLFSFEQTVPDPDIQKQSEGRGER